MYTLAFWLLGTTVTYTTTDMFYRAFPDLDAGWKDWAVVLCVITAWLWFFQVVTLPPATFEVSLEPWAWIPVPVYG